MVKVKNYYINDKGLDLIKDFEGFSAEPYKCVAGVWTIGFGSIYGKDGNRVNAEFTSSSNDTAGNLAAICD